MGRPGISARRAARIRAFQVLYGLHFNEVASIGDLERLFAETPVPENQPAGQDGGSAYAWELAQGVWTHRDRLDALIGRFSRNWRVDRMGRVELTLLRLAMFELAFHDDVPPKVVINEALDLTARFGDDQSKKFINGILDAAAREAEAGTLNSRA